MISETCSRRGDIGNQRGIGEPERRDVTQGVRAGFAAQIGDVVEFENDYGLTPVSMTL